MSTFDKKPDVHKTYGDIWQTQRSNSPISLHTVHRGPSLIRNHKQDTRMYRLQEADPSSDTEPSEVPPSTQGEESPPLSDGGSSNQSDVGTTQDGGTEVPGGQPGIFRQFLDGLEPIGPTGGIGNNSSTQPTELQPPPTDEQQLEGRRMFEDFFKDESPEEKKKYEDFKAEEARRSKEFHDQIDREEAEKGAEQNSEPIPTESHDPTPSPQSMPQTKPNEIRKNINSDAKVNSSGDIGVISQAGQAIVAGALSGGQKSSGQSNWLFDYFKKIGKSLKNSLFPEKMNPIIPAIDVRAMAVAGTAINNAYSPSLPSQSSTPDNGIKKHAQPTR